MQNNYIIDLIDFIKNNADWKDKLLKKPFSLKNIVQCPYNKNWWMFNYNLFESDLSNSIVKACRGTILEISDDRSVIKPICLAFYKFFNIGDVNCDSIDWNTAKSRIKCDGQLIKFFKVNDANYWCTNGSPCLETPLDYTDDKIEDYKDLLESAILGRTISNLAPKKNRETCSIIDKDGAWHMHTHKNGQGATGWIDKIPNGWTLMFELTSPYNRIIVNYKDIKLWFHGARDENGIEHEPEDIALKFGIPYEVPKQFDFKNFDQIFDEIKNWNGFENEGIVVCDANFHRVKVKCEDYLKIKFIREVDTPKGIFQLMISGEFDDLTSRPEIQAKVEILKEEYLNTLDWFKKFWKNINNKRKEFSDQKDFAVNYVQKYFSENSSFFYKAVKFNEQDFIDDVNKHLKLENNGYDNYVKLLDFIKKFKEIS